MILDGKCHHNFIYVFYISQTNDHSIVTLVLSFHYLSIYEYRAYTEFSYYVIVIFSLVCMPCKFRQYPDILFFGSEYANEAYAN